METLNAGIMPYKCTICEKSFRYKVSQRNHKCNGVLVRQQTGDLLKKLLQNSLILSKGGTSNDTEDNMVVNETIMLEKTSANELILTAQNDGSGLLAKNSTSSSTSPSFPSISYSENIKNEEEMCLDEFVKESYNKIITGNDNGTLQAISSTPTSPSSAISLSNQLLQDNTCLTPIHQPDSIAMPINFPNLEIINDDSIKELLYGNACWFSFHYSSLGLRAAIKFSLQD